MTVDGVDCPISSWNATVITCITGVKAVANTPQPGYAGEHGIYRTLANETIGLNRDNIADFNV